MIVLAGVIGVLVCFVAVKPVPSETVSVQEAHELLVHEHLLGHDDQVLQTLVVPSREPESAVFIVNAASPRVVVQRARHSIWNLLTVERHDGTWRARRSFKWQRRALADLPVEVERCEAPIDVVTVARLSTMWREVLALPPSVHDLGQRDGTTWVFAMDHDGVRNRREVSSPTGADGRIVVVSEALAAFACAPLSERATRLRTLQRFAVSTTSR